MFSLAPIGSLPHFPLQFLNSLLEPGHFSLKLFDVGRRPFEKSPNPIVRGLPHLGAELFGASHELAYRPVLQSRKKPLATLLDEVPQAAHRPGGGVPALLLLVDDLREGDFREVSLRAIIQDFDLFTIAHELRNAVERDIATIACIVQFAVRVPLDHADLLHVRHRVARLALRRIASRWRFKPSSLGWRWARVVQQETVFADLFKRLAQIEEIDMRVALVCEQLETLSVEQALELVAGAYRVAALGGGDAQLVFLALGWALFEPRLALRRAELGAEAKNAELHHLADFLVVPNPDEAGDIKRRIPDFGRGRPLTLGERKSLARTHDRNLIQRVVRDPHPDVVRILLDNPSLTEEDVVRICAMRPNEPGVLQAVYRHRRWVVRYRPRNAIVRNPDCPLDTALLLVPLLRPGELKEAAMASGLAPPLRLSCRSIVELREARS